MGLISFGTFELAYFGWEEENKW